VAAVAMAVAVGPARSSRWRRGLADRGERPLRLCPAHRHGGGREVAPAVVHEVARAPLRLEHLVDTPGAAGLLRAGEVIEEPALGAAPEPVGVAPGELAAHHREVEPEVVGAPRA